MTEPLPLVDVTEGMGFSILPCLLSLQQALYNAAPLLVVTSRHVVRLSWHTLL